MAVIPFLRKGNAAAKENVLSPEEENAKLSIQIYGGQKIGSSFLVPYSLETAIKNKKTGNVFGVVELHL